MDAITSPAATGMDPQLWELLADNLPQLAWVAQADGHIFWYNRRWYDYTGTTLDETAGWGWKSVHHPDEVDRVVARFSDALASGEPWEDIFPLRGADGQYRQFLSRAQPLRNAEGWITHWFGTNTDVTERIAAEKRADYLLRLEETLRQADSAAASQRAACELLRDELGASRVLYSVADVPNLRFEVAAEYVAPGVDSVSGVHEIPAAVFDRISGGQTYVTSDWTAESVLSEVAGNPEKAALPVRGLIDLPHLRSGQLVGWLSVHQRERRDWTAEEVDLARATAERTWSTIERARAEAAIRSAEERYRTVFDSAAVGIGRIAPDGPFLEINDRFCHILGRSREEITGGSWADITHPDDLAGDHALMQRVLAGEIDSYTLEKRYLAKDGSNIWINLTVSSERDQDGSVRSFISIVEDIGERKATEAALRESEERYRALFESMEQGFCIVQVSLDDQQKPIDYRFTEINPAFVRQTGLPAEVLHRSVREAVPGLEQVWFDRYGEVALTGVHQRFVEHADPLGRWFEAYAFPIGAKEDRNVAILFTDVTERIRQEEALRSSEQELRLRLNAIPQMVWSTRPDGYHDFYNDRWYEFTGTPLGTTHGDGWTGVFHSDDQPRAWERWGRSLQTGEPYEIEYRLRHHDGSYRWVLGRALPIRNEAGEIVRWMGTCIDIDDRIAAARALRESEARLRAVIESMPVGLMFAEADGAITGSNDRILEWLGHDIVASSSSEEYDKDYVAFHEDGRQVASAEYPLARALAGEDRPELECQVRRGDGSLRWLRYVAAPIRDGHGEITGGVVASIDIHREKMLTQSLEREVEKVVAEREVAQEALRQSQKLEAMGQLTGGVAHDFNNLLTPIIGSLDLLQRKQVLDQRTGRLVDGALASAEKARLLVQRLLAFARRQPLQPQAIDLARVVTEMSELVASTSGPRVRVNVDVPNHLPPALADGNQLEMALLNLAVNARDAMPDGGTLTIAARSEGADAGARLGLKGNRHLVLSVSDSGVGMDEETRRRAIEPFFSTKGVGKGTGLGLSMVHGLAAQLGGALDIRSARGVGTSIELWLPVARSMPTEDGGDTIESERQGIGTALLVDDEELVRASTASMLQDLGYAVVEAAAGEEAVTRVAGGLKPDLLVTDQLMPGLSGTDLAVRLRERLPGLPVLIVSGYADLHSLSPAFPHLSKPFRQAELAAALEKMANAD